MKVLSILLLITTFLFSSKLESIGVETSYTDVNGDEKSIVIKREKPTNCFDVKFDPKVVLGSNGASNSVSDECKRSFVTYMGKVSPIKFSEKVETYGEVEVLEFIQKSTFDDNYLLVDSRTEDWYYHSTIPSAVNVPYTYANKTQFVKEYAEMMELFNVSTKNGKYDYSKAKTVLLFCNGVWCGQSPEAMKKLIKNGYPEEKLKWYRGGIQSWISLGFPTVKPE